MKTKRCEIQPRKLKRVKYITDLSTLSEVKNKCYMASKVFESLINFFSIAYLQPPQRNFSNDVTND